MHLDVHNLRDFYYRSALGRAAQRILRDQVQRVWPDLHAHTLVGYGFTAPLLRPYLGQARRVVGLMPAPQGVLPWPQGGPNVSVLCEETLWPLETGHVDRLLMLHGLETSERPFDLLEECYRVLGPGGEMLLVVPNRSGLWARSDATPFGYGRPYSLGQLDMQLKAHDFVRQSHVSVLYQPPSSRRFWMRTGSAWEQVGRAVPAVVAGGLLVVRVTKRTPPRRKGLGNRVRVPSPLDVLAPTPEKRSKPV